MNQDLDLEVLSSTQVSDGDILLVHYDLTKHSPKTIAQNMEATLKRFPIKLQLLLVPKGVTFEIIKGCKPSGEQSPGEDT